MNGVQVMVSAATLAALLSGCHGDRIKNTAAATTTTTAGCFPPIPTPGPSDYGAIYFQTMLDYFNGVRAFSTMIDDFTTSALAIERVLPAACRELQQTQGNLREGCDALLANLKALAGRVAQA